MKKKVWESLAVSVRKLVVSAFEMGGIDFERDYVFSDDDEQSDNTASPWMTRAEAAGYAKCSTDTIDNWIAKGYIQRAKMDDSRPGGVRIERESLEKFFRSRLVGSKKRIRKMAPSVPGGYHA